MLFLTFFDKIAVIYIVCVFDARMHCEVRAICSL